MDITYTSSAKDNIKVYLHNGEVLGGFVGPVTFNVPVAPGNREYDFIVKRNLKINDFVPPVQQVPEFVTPLQARKILRLLGYIDELEALMAEATPEVRDAWEYASIINRNHPFIEEFAAELHLSDEEVDMLFIQAATL